MEHVKIPGYEWNCEKVVLITVENFSVGNACSIYEFEGNVAERLEISNAIPIIYKKCNYKNIFFLNKKDKLTILT